LSLSCLMGNYPSPSVRCDYPFCTTCSAVYSHSCIPTVLNFIQYSLSSILQFFLHMPCFHTATKTDLFVASTFAIMDKASLVLAQPFLPGLSNSYRARADRGEAPHTTLHHRACGRRSIKEKAQSQQNLTPYEEDALVHFLLQISDLG
jgi:hypothetical protein